MVFSLHQLLGRSQQFPWCHLWPILLKYSSFLGNNRQHDQDRISLPILMYYIWDLQPKNKGWHKKGEKGLRREKKNRRTFVWFNLTNAVEKKGSCPSGGGEARQKDFFLLLLHLPLCRFVSDYRLWLDGTQPWATKSVSSFLNQWTVK